MNFPPATKPIDFLLPAWTRTNKITSILNEISDKFTGISDTPALDASVLLAHILHRPRTWVLAHPDVLFTPEQQAQLNDSLMRLKRGESFPYVLGHWEFFGLDLEVTSDVLIPRPETELLVEKAIVWLQASPERRTVADIGTGSGAIAISVALHVSDTRILATDISLPALKVAQHNARKFNVLSRIDFLQCDILPDHIDPLSTEGHFDLICANLPYIPTDKLKNLAIYGREPTLALDGGADGLDAYRRLLRLCPDWLAPNGLLLLEIEATQGVQALSLAYDAFSTAKIELHQDIAGYDRLLEILVP